MFIFQAEEVQKVTRRLEQECAIRVQEATRYNHEKATLEKRLHQLENEEKNNSDPQVGW